MKPSSDYLLGVIGGMGPMASAVFMEMIIKKTNAAKDQEHIPMVVYHLPYIPDRTTYILDNTAENPLPYIIKAAKKLEADGATEIAIPCVTAHYFHTEIQNHISIPLLDGVEDTARFLADRNIRRVGILATSGTVQTGLFTRAFLPYDISCIYPDEQMQKKVMHFIYDDIKTGGSVDKNELHRVTSHLADAGAQTIILGCTELSLIPKDCLDTDTVDVLEVLADECISKR